jgi:hypothetical protein
MQDLQGLEKKMMSQYNKSDSEIAENKDALRT